ncbi:DNA-binding transcriptional repressor DeoR [Pectobacterium brasiliense]|uniref:DNA-binding transcriptional repressor DeoR n=1 Tax=Pectobacterium brasiliense TaxID=180957 RepID=A0AAE2WFV9_9GAMM|nr:DNA-binding transcriptional repressor DeoR [Pectobacterium brasiliense]MBA0218035.1 DNA-binding transcriptional repressor DeoR [Pectobacterium brasiliense]MBN3052321.1 DNA-binding transcriptional repressor DeoR [Pectobacterium brasiliense]MBN3071474.1 DNA-binding transcriptional repressor DeoR [Pectobacterium brasiliense]MBN3170838.1 DNA-binding transcriptional repressor DeoR [Pectobacterium brasiliense]
METRRGERIGRLAQALKKTDKLHLKDAAQLLGVSEMTVRRDLNADSTSVMLLGGYVVSDLKNNGVTNYFVSDQQTKHVREKRAIGTAAAYLVEANDTVFFDCGTTIPFIIDAIPDALPFTAICYSLNTFLALQEKKACRVILCGGEYHPDNAIFTPLNQRSELDNVCPNKAFISAAGIELTAGATCFNFAELGMKQRAMATAQRIILVADSSKFGQIKRACIGPVKLFDTVISDGAPSDVYLRYFSNNGIQLLHPGN